MALCGTDNLILLVSHPRCTSVFGGLKCPGMSCFWRFLLSSSDIPDKEGKAILILFSLGSHFLGGPIWVSAFFERCPETFLVREIQVDAPQFPSRTMTSALWESPFLSQHQWSCLTPQTGAINSFHIPQTPNSQQTVALLHTIYKMYPTVFQVRHHHCDCGEIILPFVPPQLGF